MVLQEACAAKVRDGMGGQKTMEGSPDPSTPNLSSTINVLETGGDAKVAGAGGGERPVFGGTTSTARALAKRRSTSTWERV